MLMSSELERSELERNHSLKYFKIKKKQKQKTRKPVDQPDKG
jgi:hypothetical protein